MTDNEIVFNPELEKWEPCRTCLDVIMDTAFSNGFTPGGDDDQPYIEEEADESIPVSYELP